MLGAWLAGSIVGKLTLDKTGWDASVRQVKQDEETLKTKAGEINISFKNLGKRLTLMGGAITGIFGLMVNQASDAQETFSKFGVVFKSVFDDAQAAVDELTTSYGLSEVAAKDLMAATGDLLTGLGMAPDVALDLSLKTQQLAVDLASFTNYAGGAAGASEALTKAMLGEREMLKSLGIVITEEMVQEELRRQGLENLTGLALQQAKAEATLRIAYEQSKNAIGDYQRTSKDLENQKRLLMARIQDLSVQLGTVLIPAVTSIVSKLSELVKKISDWAKEHPGLTEAIVKTGAALGGLLTVLGPIVMVLPQLVTGFKLLTTAVSGLLGPTGLLITSLGIISKALIDATNSAKGYLKTLDQLANLKGEKKISGFKRFIVGLDAAVTKLTTGIDLNKIAQQKLGEEMENQKEKAKEYKEAYDTISGILKDKFNKALETGKQLLKDWGLAADESKEKIDAQKESVSITATTIETALTPMQGIIDKTKWWKVEIVTIPELMDQVQSSIESAIYQTAIPAARDMKDVWANAVSDMETGIPKISKATETTTTEAKNYFDGLYNDIATGWANTIQKFLEGKTTLKQFFSDLWEDVKTSFFRVIGEMVAEWSLNFIKNLISGATTAASSITTSLGNSITQMSQAVTTVGTSIGNILVSLSKAIATSAQILASAAGAIIKVGAVAVALYAAFKLVGGVIDKLLGGGKKGSEYVTKLLEEQNWVYLTAINEKLDDVNEKLAGIWSEFGVKIDYQTKQISGSIQDLAKRTASIADAIRNLPKAQRGAVVTKPTLMMLHGTPSEPEYVMPAPVLNKVLPQKTMSPNITINVTNDVDLNGSIITDREYVKTRLMNEIINALSSAPVRKNVQRALGLVGI